MHRTLRQPAAKVARLRRRVRRGRQGVGAGRGRRGGIVCGVPFCSPMCGSTRRFSSVTLTAAPRGRSPARQRDDTRRREVALESETRHIGIPSVRPPADPGRIRNCHSAPHTRGRAGSPHSHNGHAQVAYAPQNAHGARRPNPQPPPTTINSKGLNRGTTGPSSPHQSQSHHMREPATQPANNRHPNTTPTNHQSPRWRWRRSPPARSSARACALVPPPVTHKLALGFDGWHAAAARCQRRCELQPDLIRPAVPRPPPPQWLGDCWVKPGRRLGRPRARRPPRRHPPRPDRTRMPGSPPRSR